MKHELIPIGETIGDLTVLGYPCRNQHGKRMVSVRCAKGHTKNMVSADLASRRYVKCRPCRNTRHGLAGTPEYQSAYDAVSRCLDPKDDHYRLYGGRVSSPITVEFPGKTFGSMAGAMARYLLDKVGPRRSRWHVLDRTDNDGNYAEGNLQWVTIPASLRNRRANRIITFGQKTFPLCDWATITGLPRGVISSRLNHGWSAERALTTPVRGYRHE